MKGGREKDGVRIQIRCIRSASDWEKEFTGTSCR